MYARVSVRAIRTFRLLILFSLGARLYLFGCLFVALFSFSSALLLCFISETPHAAGRRVAEISEHPQWNGLAATK